MKGNLKTWLSGVSVAVVAGVVVFLLTEWLRSPPTVVIVPSEGRLPQSSGQRPEQEGETTRCSISGLVFDRDSDEPLSGVWVDAYLDLSAIQQRPQRLQAGVATTGPDGKFSLNCGWINESQFPLLLAVRHADWVATRITGPKIDRPGEWDGINIAIPMSEVRLRPLRELRVSFTSRSVGSDWFLVGDVENRSERSFPCVTLRFSMTTSHQDRLQGEPVRDLGFLDVELRDLGPNEKRSLERQLPGQVGFGLHSKEECE